MRVQPLKICEFRGPFRGRGSESWKGATGGQAIAYHGSRRLSLITRVIGLSR
jgi:hypothetical protein